MKKSNALTVNVDEPVHFTQGKAMVEKLFAEAGRKCAATSSADDPKDAARVATFLREAADSYAKNDCGHGHSCLIRAFGYAQLLERKGLLKLEENAAAAAKKLRGVEQAMRALAASDLMAIADASRHYTSHAYGATAQG